MATSDTIEGFLADLGLTYKRIQPNMWMVEDASRSVRNIVVHLDDPVVVFRVKLLDLPPQGRHENLFRELLQLNANEMVQGAYGLEGTSVVVVDSLQAENLDQNELQGSIDALALAVTTHLPRLARHLESH